jgi:hypothetical protein
MRTDDFYNCIVVQRYNWTNCASCWLVRGERGVEGGWMFLAARDRSWSP